MKQTLMNTPPASATKIAFALTSFVATLVLSSSLHAGTTDYTLEIPAGGVSLIGAEDPIDILDFRDGSAGGGEVIAVQSLVSPIGQSFARASQIQIINQGSAFYDAKIQFTSTESVEEGDVALVHFWLRKVASDDESGLVAVHIVVEGPGPDFSKSLSTVVSAGDEWREIFLPFRFNADYPAGETFFYFGFGQTGKPMTMEIGGVELLNYGQTIALSDLPRTRITYPGMEPGALWRAEADARIQEYRKGDFRIRVVDGSGSPVEGARVGVEMVRHAFKFGSTAQAFRIMGTTEDDRIYRRELLELFNSSGPENGTKWGAWDGEWGDGTIWNRDQTLEALEWMAANDLSPRGHVLVWPGYRNLPDSIRALLPSRDPAIPQMVLDHIDDITQATKPFINEWDVLNEPYDNHDLMDIFGPEIMVDWFNRARLNLPTAELYINDYGILSARGRDLSHQQHFEDTIRYLLENGAPLTGIGMQGHMGEAPTEPTKLWEVLERYANAFPDLKIKITEFDVTTTDEDFQADYTRDFMTLVFSHPSVVGLQFWGFWEGAHWYPSAALFRRDWSEKPNLEVYRDLVFDQWWTREDGETDSDGSFSGRGFYGDYVLKVRTDKQIVEMEFPLTPEDDGLTEVVIAVDES